MLLLIQKKGVWLKMFDIAIQFMIQLISLIPGVFGIYILFDLIGSLLFNKRQFMKDILIGFALMFTVYSCVQFWFWFIDLEKGKQVKLKDYIFGGKK